MTDTDGAAGVDLADVVARARELPTRLRSLRVETHGWIDVDRWSLASDRARGLLAHRLPARADAPVRREVSNVRSWMEFGPDAWTGTFIELWPARWREEREQTQFDDERSRVVSARDGDAYWSDHGEGPTVTDASQLRMSLSAAWVVSRRWTSDVMQRDLLDASSSVLGRPGARIRVAPQPESRWRLRHMFVGEAHELIVDLATGMTLAVTSVIDGTAFQHDEVTDLEIDAPVVPALTEVPPGAEVVPASQGHRTLEELAAAAGLPLLAPTWLPPEYSFQSGGLYVKDEVPEAALTFSRDRREFISLYEWPESQARGEGGYVWERVERAGRTVLISDVSDRVGERVAQITLDGTWATINASLSAPDLLDIAFSLERVPTE